MSPQIPYSDFLKEKKKAFIFAIPILIVYIKMYWIIFKPDVQLKMIDYILTSLQIQQVNYFSFLFG